MHRLRNLKNKLLEVKQCLSMGRVFFCFLFLHYKFKAFIFKRTNPWFLFLPFFLFLFNLIFFKDNALIAFQDASYKWQRSYLSAPYDDSVQNSFALTSNYNKNLSSISFLAPTFVSKENKERSDNYCHVDWLLFIKKCSQIDNLLLQIEPHIGKVVPFWQASLTVGGQMIPRWSNVNLTRDVISKNISVPAPGTGAAHGTGIGNSGAGRMKPTSVEVDNGAKPTSVEVDNGAKPTSVEVDNGAPTEQLIQSGRIDGTLQVDNKKPTGTMVGGGNAFAINPIVHSPPQDNQKIDKNSQGSQIVKNIETFNYHKEQKRANIEGGKALEEKEKTAQKSAIKEEVLPSQQKETALVVIEDRKVEKSILEQLFVEQALSEEQIQWYKTRQEEREWIFLFSLWMFLPLGAAFLIILYMMFGYGEQLWQSYAMYVSNVGKLSSGLVKNKVIISADKVFGQDDNKVLGQLGKVLSKVIKFIIKAGKTNYEYGVWASGARSSVALIEMKRFVEEQKKHFVELKSRWEFGGASDVFAFYCKYLYPIAWTYGLLIPINAMLCLLFVLPVHWLSYQIFNFLMLCLSIILIVFVCFDVLHGFLIKSFETKNIGFVINLGYKQFCQKNNINESLFKRWISNYVLYRLSPILVLIVFCLSWAIHPLLYMKYHQMLPWVYVPSTSLPVLTQVQQYYNGSVVHSLPWKEFLGQFNLISIFSMQGSDLDVVYIKMTLFFEQINAFLVIVVRHIVIFIAMYFIIINLSAQKVFDYVCARYESLYRKNQKDYERFLRKKQIDEYLVEKMCDQEFSLELVQPNFSSKATAGGMASSLGNGALIGNVNSISGGGGSGCSNSGNDKWFFDIDCLTIGQQRHLMSVYFEAQVPKIRKRGLVKIIAEFCYKALIKVKKMRFYESIMGKSAVDSSALPYSKENDSIKEDEAAANRAKSMGLNIEKNVGVQMCELGARCNDSMPVEVAPNSIQKFPNDKSNEKNVGGFFSGGSSSAGESVGKKGGARRL